VSASAVEIATALCQRFEGFIGHPYLCAAGVPTIGYGATHYLDGRRVTLKDAPISKEAAYRLLVKMIETQYLPTVLGACPRLAAESPLRLAAIIDWTFNLGGGNLRASTMRRKINAADWDAVPTEILKWNKAGGRVLRGLTIRRQAEANLIPEGAVWP
jgi:lysozyme